MALACSTPPNGRERWTMQLLADRVVEVGLIDTISDETIRRTLKKTIPSPGWRSSGVSRPRVPSLSGVWKTCWICMLSPMTLAFPWCVLTRVLISWWRKCANHPSHDLAPRSATIINISVTGRATCSCSLSRVTAGGMSRWPPAAPSATLRSVCVCWLIAIIQRPRWFASSWTISTRIRQRLCMKPFPGWSPPHFATLGVSLYAQTW